VKKEKPKIKSRKKKEVGRNLARLAGGGPLGCLPSGKITISPRLLWRQFLLALAYGACFLSLSGLFTGNLPRLARLGSLVPIVVFIVIFLGIIASIVVIGRRWRLEKRGPLGPVKPLLPLLPFSAASLVLGVILGAWLAGLAWHAASSLALNHATHEVVAAGYHVETPASADKDYSDDNAATWLQRVGADQAAKDLMQSDGKSVLGKVPVVFLSDFLRNAANGKTDPGPLAKIKKALSICGKVVDLSKQAARAKQVNWGINTHKPPYEMEVPRMAGLLGTARLLACQAVVDASEGRQEQAVECVRAGLAMGRAVTGTSCLIGDMIGVAINNIALSAAVFVLDKCPVEKARQAWGPYLKPGEPPAGVKKRLEWEFFGIADYYSRLEWMPSKDGLSVISEDWPPSFFDQLSWALYWPFLDFDIASKYRGGKQMLDSLALPYTQMKPAWQKAQDDFEKHAWLLAAISMPRFSEMYAKGLGNTAKMRLTLLAMAMKDYRDENKAWPSSLDKLDFKGLEKDVTLDPFTGEKMRLIKIGGRPVIYSLGPDGVDDKAAVDYEKTKEKGDISWRL
jgi:hypothetical protein